MYCTKLEARKCLFKTELTQSQERSEISSLTKRIFISADHGVSIIYFLQSDVISTQENCGRSITIFSVDTICSQSNY